MTPDEQALRADLASARFLAGEDRNRWQLHNMAWPFVFVSVVARDGRLYALRLDCRGFPNAAPTGTFWDLTANIQLPFDQWPTGGERIRLTFRPDWKGGSALYIPCDRESFAGHDAWAAQYPQLLWKPTRGVSHYLEIVQDLLHSRDYVCAA